MPPRTAFPLRLAPPAEAVAFTGPGDPLARIAVGELTLAPGDTLVTIEMATLCPADGLTVRADRRSHGAHVIGHEQVGRIAALGAGDPPLAIDGAALRVGDRVVWAITIACGQCHACERGLPALCARGHSYGHEPVRRGWELSGGLSTHAHLVAGTAIARVSEALPAEVAAPANCAVATVMAALEAAARVRPLRAETAVVTGCDARGLTAVAALREAGARVIAVDIDASRRAQARRFGAVDAVEPRKMPRDIDLALECSGGSEMMSLLIERAGIGATIVLVGDVFPPSPGAAVPLVHLDSDVLVRRQLTVRGVFGSRPDHLASAVRFLERADLPAFAALVSETVPLSRAEHAYAAAAAGARVAVVPERDDVAQPRGAW